VDSIQTTTLVGAVLLAAGAVAALFTLRGVPDQILDPEADDPEADDPAVPAPAAR
jgi:DHA2 family multidrug resistance protein-like MFS transporter